MGMGAFLQKRFLNKRICLYLEEEAETLLFSETWQQNKEFLDGVLKAVEDGVLVFFVEGAGTGIVYIDSEWVKMAWEPGFSYRDAVRGAMTNEKIGAR